MALRFTLRFWRAAREESEFSWGSAVAFTEGDITILDRCSHLTQALRSAWKKCPTKEQLLKTIPAGMRDRGVTGDPIE